MRNVKFLIAAALVASTAGCIETLDSGYPTASYGYGSGYDTGYYSSGYYAQPTYYQPPVNNYYYAPAPRVVTETRFVPVPVPTPAPQRWTDHRWDGRHDDQRRDDRPSRVEHQNAATPPAVHPAPQAHSSQPPSSHHHGNGQDGDGRTDHRG